jgi:hypothetical protein
MKYYGANEEKVRRSGNVGGGHSHGFHTIHPAENLATERHASHSCPSFNKVGWTLFMSLSKES